MRDFVSSLPFQTCNLADDIDSCQSSELPCTFLFLCTSNKNDDQNNKKKKKKKKSNNIQAIACDRVCMYTQTSEQFALVYRKKTSKVEQKIQEAPPVKGMEITTNRFVYAHGVSLFHSK